MAAYSCSHNLIAVGNASCMADGNLSSVPYCGYSSLTGYSYCSGVGAVLQRTHDNKLFNFTVAQEICRLQNGSLLSPKAFTSRCTRTLLGDTRIAWINQFEAGKNEMIAFVTGGPSHNASTRFLKTPLYVVCEIACSASAHIFNISASGIVTCKPGYEYLYAHHPCEPCTPVQCNVTAIANGTSDRAVINFGENVTYSCAADQGIMGDATPSCQADRQLSSIPYCAYSEVAGKTTPAQQVPIQRQSQASQNPGQFPRSLAVANTQVSKNPGLSGMTSPTPPVPDQGKSQTSQSPGQSQQPSPATDGDRSAPASDSEVAGKTTPAQQVPIQRKSQASQNPGQFPRSPAEANTQVSKNPGLSGMTPPTPPVPDQRKSQPSQSPGQSQQTSPTTDEDGSAPASGERISVALCVLAAETCAGSS
ncbi:mucin-2-like [Sycon ciliatum]|uniref:mucin-2-like n=1 Tax=Sycon ciliatum TaxID=27933 RepID=UPI0031F68E0B